MIIIVATVDRELENKEEGNMDKNQIIETAFEVIKESTEWGVDEESKTYGYWIDGVITVVDDLLNKIDKNCKTTKN